jgi:hypothetical protein
VNTTSTGAAISGRWYNDEMPLYQDLYGQESPSNANFPNWGHFSQMVWKETTSLGCYTQYCPGGVSEPVTPESPILVNHPDQNWNTVCNYSPAGKPDPLCMAVEYMLTALVQATRANTRTSAALWATSLCMPHIDKQSHRHRAIVQASEHRFPHRTTWMT